MEDAHNHYIVSEVCFGGTLNDQLKAGKKFNENEAIMIIS